MQPAQLAVRVRLLPAVGQLVEQLDRPVETGQRRHPVGPQPGRLAEQGPGAGRATLVGGQLQLVGRSAEPLHPAAGEKRLTVGVEGDLRGQQLDA